MGYTHYWHKSGRGMNAGFHPNTWTAFLEDCKKLIDAWDGKLAFEGDEPNKPVQMDENTLRFNGLDEADDGYETFVFDRNSSGSYCKTGRRPYDLVVAGVLIIAKSHFVDLIDISSDGDPNEWRPAVEFVLKVFGTKDEIVKADFPFDENYIRGRFAEPAASQYVNDYQRICKELGIAYHFFTDK